MVLRIILRRFNIAVLFLIGIFLLQHDNVFCQKSPVFISPEFMVGKIVQNYESFPGATTRKTLVLNMGRHLNNLENHSHNYYNFPHAGLSIGFSDLGNKESLGQEFSFVPYLLINASKKLRHSWNFKIGLGGSYFTRIYEPENNRNNKAIGSHLNWTFQLFLYHSIYLSEHVNILLGGGYWHSSNSHIQLPNFGLNSAMLTLSCQYYFDRVNLNIHKENSERLPLQKFIQFRTGLGVHELGSTIGPAYGPKRPVYTFDGNYGFLFNKQLKIYGGLYYRFYSTFYHYLKDNESDENSIWEASNINFHLGVEYLLGHVGMNCEGGINLFKPFYDEFYDLFENGDSFNEFRMSTFNTRMGMNLYLINTNKSPKNNLALGAHINANFGKADFGEISLIYIKNLK